MKSIGSFLSKFNSLTPPDDSVKNAVLTAVQDVVGAPLQKRDLNIKNGVVYVKASSVLKSAIMVNRARILEALFDTLPKSRDTVRDIR